MHSDRHLSAHSSLSAVLKYAGDLEAFLRLQISLSLFPLSDFQKAE